MTGEITKLYSYETRLQTFNGWPFEEDCSCTPENVSVPRYLARVGGKVTCYLELTEQS